MAAEINTAVWKLYKVCSCGGTLKHKYRNTGNARIELHILPNRATFNVLENGRLIDTGKTTEIKTKLNKYEPAKKTV